ncbi:hypothetical protein [Actinomadura parmotrematis]|uniref:Resolvase/invertase-type recombinase catalytic domain-containing protein n=1 Tax=Actinomadura parmotrematis TaxID=2864039 RepID=A0ABS7G3I3_9ACTN|nr:hypothetical protein [Actinomadura parmotrematis]MBW8487281.1 hypothetical protein [Actinomadura parmotrematis]
MMRFALYGHAIMRGTERFTPRFHECRCLAAAEELTAPHGSIVARYFDLDREQQPGTSRRGRPTWDQCPQARALTQAVGTDLFDAVVIPELNRHTFHGVTLWDFNAYLRLHGKQLWTLGTAGPVDPTNPTHVLYLLLFAGVAAPSPPVCPQHITDCGKDGDAR